MDTDEVLRDKTNEILDQVVSEDGLGSSHLRIFVHLRKFSEIVLRREHGLEGVEYAVLGLLANLVAGVFGRGEQCLELFDHYKRGQLCVKSMKKNTKQVDHSSLQVHLALTATTAGRTGTA